MHQEPLPSVDADRSTEGCRLDGAAGRGTRVLIFNGSDSLGGDTKVAHAVARALAATCDLRVLSAAGPAAAAFRGVPGAKVLEVPVIGGQGRIGRALLLATWFVLAVFELLRTRPQVVYTYDRTRVSDVSLLVSLLARRRVVFHVNHFGTVEQHPLRYRAAARWAEVWFINQFVASAVRAQGLAPRRERVILNCLTDDPATETRAAAREQLGLPQDTTVAVIVGRLSPFKGQATFVRAMARPELAGAGLLGLVVGGDTGEGVWDDPPHPDYMAFLRDLVAEPSCGPGGVVLAGQQPGTLAFRAADIACVLSDAEPFGLVVAEAVAAGLPVIATASGGIPELFANGETALLVPPRDPAATAVALASLCDDPQLRDRLSAAARESVLPLLSFARFARDVQSAIRANAAPSRS